MTEYRSVGNMEKELNRTCMDTLAKSQREKTKENFSASCVGRSAGKGVLRWSMWRLFTFQEVASISVTNVMKSLTPRQSGAITALACTPARSQSECQYG